MAWDEKRAKDRVAKRDADSFEVNVADLKRTLDFSNLSTKDVRRVQGAHIYADVPNFHLAVEDAGGDKQKQKKLIRAASVLRKVQGDLLRDEDVKPIQLQTARLHCLNYTPYDHDDEDENKKRQGERAERAVTMAITLNSYLYDVFNKVFEDDQHVRKFEGAVGVASGETYVANIGFHGERERISLGTSANLGAKILDGSDTITVTKDVYDLLPDNLKEPFSKSRTVAGTVTYQASELRWSKKPELQEELGVSFDADSLKKKTEGYRDDLRLDEMEVIEANKLIDPTVLTERNNRRTDAVAIFADLDGFTKYVQETEDDEDVESLVRKLHMIRTEFHAVAKKDFEGLVIQHQGDRMVALVHTPTGDDNFDKRCRRAVDLATGLQSSMEHVLNERLGDQKDLHLAVGLDVGRAIVTRLGKQGRRLVIFLGPEVETAEDLQLRSGARETRISPEIYDALESGTLKDQFDDDGDGAYVARNLTFPRIADLEEEEAAKSNRLGVNVKGGVFSIGVASDPKTPTFGASKPWADNRGGEQA